MSMQELDDNALLREYAERDSEEAFAALVTRHVNKVYSIALRQTRNPHQAEEITQAVFVILAKKSRALPKTAIVSGWLCRTTQLTAVTFLRSEIRRARREQEAYMQTLLNEPESDVWPQIAPLLDVAMAGLSETDHHAIVLRFYDGKSMREIGVALGANEETAKKRVNRAVEKLRTFFTKRGVVVPAAVLTAAISANSVQAAPALLAKTATAVALAKGATASVSTSTLIKGALKFMAWAKAKTAIAMGAGVMLLAAGVATGIATTRNTLMEDSISKLEHQTGQTIVWDKRLHISEAPNFKNVSLPVALDELSVQAGAYWTVDYAVYGSKAALDELVRALQGGIELQDAGWTNLSSRTLKPEIHVVTYGGSGGMRMGTNVSHETVGMVVVLDAKASAKQNQNFRKWIMQNRGEFHNGQFTGLGPGPLAAQNDGPRTAIEQAMKDGTADGVLAPERLLAENNLLSKINPDRPMLATPEAAAQIAKFARSKWTTIYTLRKSPVEGAGIKLIHAGQQAVYSDSGTNSFSPDAILKRTQERHLNLSPDETAAHERAAEALKRKQ